MVGSNIFIFTPTWGRFPIWLIFFKWVGSTTKQWFWSKFVSQLNRRFQSKMVQIFDSLRCYRASHVKYSNSPSRITTVGMFHKMEKKMLALFEPFWTIYLYRERSDSIIDVLFKNMNQTWSLASRWANFFVEPFNVGLFRSRTLSPEISTKKDAALGPPW